MLQLIVEILHLVVAGAMSFIGVEYNRAPECDPVQIEPAAYYQQVDLSTAGEIHRLAPVPPAAPQAISDCGSAAAPARLPQLHARIQA